MEAVLDVRGFDLTVEGGRRDAATAHVAKGSIAFTYLEGGPPTGPEEIALGPALARSLDVGIDDEVTLDELGREARVTGMVLARGDTGETYADTVVVDDDIREESTGGGSNRSLFVRFADGVDVDAASAELGARFEAHPSEPPRRIDDLSQIRNLPLVLAAAAALLGIVLLGHALVVSIRRRGRELAVLRALGASPRQGMTAVLVMTVLIVAAGFGVGIPMGFLVGNLAWRAVADGLHVAGDLAAPVLAAVLCLPVALVAGCLVAAVPTLRARRLEVADQLRRE